MADSATKPSSDEKNKNGAEENSSASAPSSGDDKSKNSSTPSPPPPSAPPPTSPPPPSSPPPPEKNSEPPKSSPPPKRQQSPPPPPAKDENTPTPPPPDQKSPGTQPPPPKDDKALAPPPPQQQDAPPDRKSPPASAPSSDTPVSSSPPPPPASLDSPSLPEQSPDQKAHPPPSTANGSPAITPNQAGPVSPHHSSPPNTQSLAPPNSDTGHAPSDSGNTNHLPVALGAAGFFLIAFVAIFFVFIKKKKKKKAEQYPPPGNYIPPNTAVSEGFYSAEPHSGPFSAHGSPHPSNESYRANGGTDDVIGGAMSFFSYEEVMEMTSGFSHQNVIGEGGFGCVYKGKLSDGKLVAIKNLKAGGGQGDREFKAEVEIISRVHHRHLVSLVGYCIAENHRVLIYEFVPNNTLEHHLHGKGMPVLEWSKRIKIALGAAKGLAYLHEDCHPKIIHRDIKSANILLDEDFEAQVADFGLARPNSGAHTHVSTRVMGTFGYLAPEYASSGKLTDKSDVYSFGVVLLELITGRKPVDPTQPLGDESLVEWARPILIRALETGDISDLVDSKLGKQYVESELMRMIEAAAACIRHSAPKRPRMAQVVRALDCESDMSDLTNGVKYGQSTVYDSGQYNQDIQRFRRMAFGSGDYSDLDYSGDYATREYPHIPPNSSWSSLESAGGYKSPESDIKAQNSHGTK